MAVLVTTSYSTLCQSCSPLPVLHYVSLVRRFLFYTVSVLFAASCSTLCRSCSPLSVLHSVSLVRRFLIYTLSVLFAASCSTLCQFCSPPSVLHCVSLVHRSYFTLVNVGLVRCFLFHSLADVSLVCRFMFYTMSVLLAYSTLLTLLPLFTASCFTLCQSYSPLSVLHSVSLVHCSCFTLAHVRLVRRSLFYTMSVLFATPYSTLCQSCSLLPVRHCVSLVLCFLFYTVSVLFAVYCSVQDNSLELLPVEISPPQRRHRRQLFVDANIKISKEELRQNISASNTSRRQFVSTSLQPSPNPLS